MNYHVPYTDAVPIRAVAPSEYENMEFVDQHIEVKKRKSTTNDTNRKKPMSKQPRKGHKAHRSEEQVKSGDKVQQENHNDDYHEVNIDISWVPAPFCSCTGIDRGCYKWGTAGWQSKCCTTTLSEYPLPMSPSKPGARLSGRKMSPGAYKKVLYRLAAEGCDLSHRVDLKDHWAKHGTNKYIKIT